ncbi:WYL domain-containing protein [Deinococcus planocerae]|uniref:WYL domain-containing protein n=1 Tax=Deinococcus planocerae TaxID=1737569 RepID=UPI000C7EDF1B
MKVWGGDSGHSEVTVRLRFTPDAGYRLLKGRDPHLVDPLILTDGSLELEVRAGTDAAGVPGELLAWILPWGEQVEVLTPCPVREVWLSRLGPHWAG